MTPTLADIDLEQLSSIARWTLDNISIPISEGVTVEEIAERLDMTPAEVQQHTDDLAAEWQAITGGPTVPDMSPEEFDALVASIEEHGQLIPIFTDARGLAGIIDGRNRRRACAKLRIEPRWQVIVERALEDDELQRLALVVNVARRQLPAGARRGFVAAELKRDATRSDRAIAVVSGVSPSTVGKVRRELERRGELSKMDSRTSIDGAVRPAAQLRTSPQPRIGLSERGVRTTPEVGDGVSVKIAADLAAELVRGWSPAVQIKLEHRDGAYALVVRRAVAV